MNATWQRVSVVHAKCQRQALAPLIRPTGKVRILGLYPDFSPQIYRCSHYRRSEENRPERSDCMFSERKYILLVLCNFPVISSPRNSSCLIISFSTVAPAC